MIKRDVTWPSTAEAMQRRVDTVTSQVGNQIHEATDRLNAIVGDAGYMRHPLSAEAEALLDTRNELASLLNEGVVLTASPYQFQVGNQQDSGKYLNPQSALATLSHKLNDHVDKNRPVGALHCIAIMVSEPQLPLFASRLTQLTSFFALPDWCQVARQSTGLSTHAVDKFHQAAAIAQPRFKPQASMNVNPIRALLKQQGAQIAMLESLANDKTNVVEKLQLLAEKRINKLTEISRDINALKAIKGSVWSASFSGSGQSIATQLNQVNIPNNHQYTVASLLISSTPLTFFNALFCGK